MLLHGDLKKRHKYWIFYHEIQSKQKKAGAHCIHALCRPCHRVAVVDAEASALASVAAALSFLPAPEVSTVPKSLFGLG